MRILLTLIIMTMFTGTLQSETISGTWGITASGSHSYETGPRFFGNLPEGNITEIAVASSDAYSYELSGYAPIPLPTYQDGTSANLGEILFTVRFDDVDWGGVPISIYCYWDGVSSEVSAGTGADYTYLTFTVHSWAFRQGPVGAASMDFSVLKTMFE
jgi:hypothetical protein